jgi:AraC family transcriptional regulator of adaptative response/methylated-DNA-[protein]-cysteine methyltransferase
VRQAQAVATACRLIVESDELPSLRHLAQAVVMSPGYLQRLFKRATGLTPKEYAHGHRAGRVQKALPKRATVTEALYEAGFNSSGRFYARSGKMLGMRPSEYRSGGRGQTIRFAITECSLGFVLVACSGKGVCAVSLGDDPARLARNLPRQFPRATVVDGDATFEKLVAAVVEFVESPERPLALPLDIRGTAFQQRVWKELQRIPAGERVSYSELAKRLGQPRSVRAVAGACAANRIAVAIPCHRVVRSDGSLSGYRWGVARKKQLLARERRWG